MKMLKVFGVLMAVGWVATCFMMGCGANDITNSDQIIFPDSNVSFTQQVQPFLTLSCDSYGCHDQSRSDNKYVALNSFADVRTINVVNQPGDTTCNLVRIVSGIDLTHAAPIHPTANQRQGIKQWVKEGAKDN